MANDNGNPFKAAFGEKIANLKEKERIARKSGNVAERTKPASKASPSAAPANTYEERIVRNMAYAGVAPLSDEKGKVVRNVRPDVPTPNARVSSDEAARQRMAELIASDLSFTIESRDPFAMFRDGTHASHLAALRTELRVNREIDLHGMRVPEAKALIAKTIKTAHKLREDFVLIVTGKGNHSQGEPVLRNATIEALQKGGGAPFVLAACDAPAKLGGTGALLIKIERVRKSR